MFRPACVAVACQTKTSAHFHCTSYCSSSSSQPRKAVAQSSKALHTDSVRSHKSRHAQQRCRHCACQASKPKSSEHPPDNGTEERKSSNSEAGTSGADTPASQKPGKPPNKQVAVLPVKCPSWVDTSIMTPDAAATHTVHPDVYLSDLLH